MLAAYVEANDVNQLVDEKLEALGQDAKMDPLEIPEFVKHFEQRILGIKMKGQIKMWNGQLEGLSNLKRDGDVTTKNDGDKLVISMRLIDENLKASSDIQLILGNYMNKHSKAEVFVGYIKVRYAVAIVDEKFQLEQFEIDEMKNIKINIHGSMFDHLINVLAEAYFKLFSMHARAKLAKILRPKIAEAIEKKNE